MREERGVSPIVATILLVALTMAAATPVVWWLSSYYAPFRPKFVDVAVYAGRINENILRFHVQHIGGETITFRMDKPTTEEIRAWAKSPATPDENELYCWTFENPEKFRQSDWVFAEVRIDGANFEVGGLITIRLVSGKAGILFNGDVVINAMDQIPGG